MLLEVSGASRDEESCCEASKAVEVDAVKVRRRMKNRMRRVTRVAMKRSIFRP